MGISNVLQMPNFFDVKIAGYLLALAVLLCLVNDFMEDFVHIISFWFYFTSFFQFFTAQKTVHVTGSPFKSYDINDNYEIQKGVHRKRIRSFFVVYTTILMKMTLTWRRLQMKWWNTLIVSESNHLSKTITMMY